MFLFSYLIYVGLYILWSQSGSSFFIIISFRVFNQIKVYLCYVILLLFQTPMMWPAYICIDNIKCLVNKKGAKKDENSRMIRECETVLIQNNPYFCKVKETISKSVIRLKKMNEWTEKKAISRLHRTPTNQLCLFLTLLISHFVWDSK